MDMFTIILAFSIVSYAISNMFVFAMGPFHIFDKIRNTAKKIHPQLEELFSCMICFPTWVGMGLSAVNLIFLPYYSFTPFNLILPGSEWYIIILLDGFFASGSTWLIHTVQEAIERTNSVEE
jgi:hypothetical protein